MYIITDKIKNHKLAKHLFELAFEIPLDELLFRANQLKIESLYFVNRRRDLFHDITDITRTDLSKTEASKHKYYLGRVWQGNEYGFEPNYYVLADDELTKLNIDNMKV